MGKRFLSVLVLGGLLALWGCGPVAVGPNNTGDDDDDGGTPTPTPPASGSFSVSSSDPTLDMWLGESGEVVVTVTPENGYEGTVGLSPKTVLGDVSVEFLDMSDNPIDSVVLDGTNPVDLKVAFAADVVENGLDLTVPAPYDGVFQVAFADGARNETLDIDTKIGPIWVYTLNEAATTDPNEPLFPNATGTINIVAGTAPVFVHNGAASHTIHTGGIFDHMAGGIDFSNGTAWSPVTDAAYDLTDPVDVADLEANALAAEGNASFYCHDHGSGSHEGQTSVTAVAP